jgi:tetratricopeptide (TPR) repeat protein
MTRISIIATLAIMGVAGWANTSGAAEAVIGGKVASNCYQIAETNGDAHQGVAICELALEKDSLNAHDRASTFVNLGVLQARLSNEMAALASYDKALKEDSSLAEAYVDRSSALIALKDYRAALDSANQAISTGPREPELAYFNRAIAEEGLGNLSAAYSDLKQTEALTPGFTQATEELKRFHVVRAAPGGT